MRILQNHDSSPRLPSNIEAEKSVLGAILLQNALIHKVIERGLKSSDFYLPSHQKLYESMLILVEKNSPIDMVILSGLLKDRGWYDLVGGVSALTTLFDEAFMTGNVISYADMIKKKAILRKLIEATSEILQLAHEEDQEPEELVDEIGRKVLSIMTEARGQKAPQLRDTILQNIQTMESLALNQSELIGLPTGFKDFDRITGGLRPGQLVILAARPAMGKTSLFLSMAKNAVNHDQNAVVMIFSLEMSQEELGFRLLSSESQIPGSRLKVGNLALMEWSKISAAARAIVNTKLQIEDRAEMTILEIKSRCRLVLAQEKRLDLVFVDYLQLIKSGRNSNGNDSTREREVSEISRGLKSLAKELKVPVLALSQLNRGLENRPNKRPLLSDLRESGSIEADADIVTFIYRDEVYHPETDDQGIAELIIAKHRAGPTGTVKLRWLPETTQFKDLEDVRPIK